MQIYYLSQVEHSQVSVHFKGFFRVCFFVEPRCLFELTPDSQYVSQENVMVIFSFALTFLYRYNDN